MFRLSLLYFRISFFLHTDIYIFITVSYDILAIACLNLLCVSDCIYVSMCIYVYVCMYV